MASWAARVRATGSRSHAGQRVQPRLDRRAEGDEAGGRQQGQLEPDVPQHRGCDQQHHERRKHEGRGGVGTRTACLPSSMAPAMSAARTTDGLAPTSTT